MHKSFKDLAHHPPLQPPKIKTTSTKKFSQTLQSKSPPPRLEGEGQGGGVEHQRVGEAAFLTDACSPPIEGVDYQPSIEASERLSEFDRDKIKMIVALSRKMAGDTILHPLGAGTVGFSKQRAVGPDQCVLPVRTHVVEAPGHFFHDE